MVTPWVLVESWKSVLPPPGSVIVMVCVITLRLQKVPRATTSRTRGDEAVLLVQSAHGEDHDAAIGDGVQQVVGGAQHAAAGDVFGNREALPDQQILGIQDGQDRRRRRCGVAASARGCSRGRGEDLSVDDAGFGIDGIAADIGGRDGIRELRQVVGVAVEAILADHRPGAVGGHADARPAAWERPPCTYAVELTPARVVAVEGLRGAAIGDAVDEGAVGIGGQCGRNHLRREGIESRRAGSSPGRRRWPASAWRRRWGRRAESRWW